MDRRVYLLSAALGAALALALLLVPAAAHAQPAPAPPPPSAGITLTAQETDALIQALADVPARYSMAVLQFLMSKRQATAPAAAAAP